MCILFIAINQHQDYPLVIAANRDEFYARPTSASAFWPERPDILAGKDLQAGGSWMGINRNGRVAALTNVRDPQQVDPNARSRGELVLDYLKGEVTDKHYQQGLVANKTHYNGYNLLYGNWSSLAVYNNHLDEHVPLSDGVYGLSNANLDSPWPKINRGVTALREYTQRDRPLARDELFALLRDDTVAQDHMLPQTGIPIEWERTLSSIFIHTDGYGTRASTLLLIDNHQQANWYERSFNERGQQVDEKNYHFSLI